uniref:Dymeclin n=1 Tax=Chenopodium quinoa TaxID=63459 RepID=A0A803N119_CHEQI
MGSVPSTPRNASVLPQDTVEYVIATFVGEKSFPLTSEFWHKLLELPLQFHWPPDRVRQACDSLAQKNYYTRHLAKLLVHLSYCLQDCISCPGAPSITFTKALNAAYLSSVFLTHTIENSKTGNFEELHLSLDNHEVPSGYPKDQSVENIVIRSVLSFIGTIEASPHTYQLHCELLNFMMAAMSTQLLSGPSSGPKDFHPFLDAIMSQEASLIASVVSKLLVNYISQPRSGFSGASYSAFEGSQSGVLQKVGSAAANFVLFPLNLIVGSNNEASKSLLAQNSLHILLILVHFRKCAVADDPIIGKNDGNGASDALHKEKTHFCENPFCKALENARDVEFDRLDVEGNAHSGPLARVPFASLYDTLGMCLADEAAILLLYSLVHGNADFLEYVLVRTDLDTLLIPILEILYNAPKRTSNQIYMLLIILLILSQDSTFNASVHKLDVYLHTNCLAALANMAPHVHRLDAYASQRLVSLFHMLSRKYTKLAELQNDKMQINKVNSTEGDNMLEDVSMELHIYTDFLRIVLEIINAILTYALPRNPEVVYAVMHRQEIFQPFRNHPRFNELLENIFTVLDFFNTRMDAQELDGEWSVEKVLQVITNNCKSWRGEGMKMFTQLRFTYEQESHPEEFFIPYVWQLAVAKCGFAFSPSKINLFSVDLPRETAYSGEGDHKNRDGELSAQEVELDP